MKRVKTGDDFRKAREKLGLTKVDVATIMRLPSPKASGYVTVKRWEWGEQRTPGSALVLMEALLTGWRPLNWKGK